MKKKKKNMHITLFFIQHICSWPGKRRFTKKRNILFFGTQNVNFWISKCEIRNPDSSVPLRKLYFFFPMPELRNAFLFNQTHYRWFSNRMTLYTVQ